MLMLFRARQGKPAAAILLRASTVHKMQIYCGTVCTVILAYAYSQSLESVACPRA